MTGSAYRLPNGTVPVLLSGDSHELVRDDAAALLSYAAGYPEAEPQAIAEMVFRTRTVRRHRTLAMVTDRDELIGALRAVVDGAGHPALVRADTPASTRRLAYVCPGQGGQRPGMGRLFYESDAAFRAESDRCAEAFQTRFGESPLGYLLDEHLHAEDNARAVQPALFTQMAGLAAMWRSWGIAPGTTIGHSQGEIVAAYVSGMMSLADAVLVVGVRARAADELASDEYAMAVIAADRDTCEDAVARCSGWAQLSVVNSPSMTGISGDRETVQAIVDTLTEGGTFARVIRVRYPAHTALINRVGDMVRAATKRHAANPKFLDTDTDCIGATLGGPITADLPLDQYWFWNLRNTVRFDKAIMAAARRGVDTFVELAEHPTLQLAIQENLTVVASERTTTVVGTSDRTATNLDVFTRNLALLALHDVEYSWECLRTEPDGPTPWPLLDFPNTPMGEVRLWQPYGCPPVGPAAQVGSAPIVNAVTPAAPVPARRLVEEWVRLSHRSLVPPRAIGVIDHTGACANLAADLCAAAEDVGATARVIGVGVDIENISARSDLDTHVILLGRSPELDDSAAAAEVATFFENRTWWPGLRRGVTDCWLVTVGGEAAVAEDVRPDPVHAGISAGFRCIGAEFPGVRFRHLDLPPASTRGGANAILTALHTAEESELALRTGRLYAKRIVEPGPAVVESDMAPFQHVLIIGGTGNLGLEFCDHFARAGARRITLVSRSGETAGVANRLRRIRSTTSACIRVATCDVGDQAAVSRLAAQHHDAPADLIIHAAVDYSDIELADIDAESADAALRAKVVGIWLVLATCRRTDSCRVVLCSSTAATIGGRGQVLYAAANRMLDAMAYRLRAEGVDCVSVQWGQWTVHLELDVSARAKLAGTGVLPMSPGEALALGMCRLSENVIVAAFDSARARSALKAYGYGPLVSLLTLPIVERPPAAQNANLTQRFVKLVADTIGADDVDAIDTGVPLVALGLDSLQALELRRRVQSEFDYELAVSELLGGATIVDVLARLHALSPLSARAVASPDLVEDARQAAERVLPSDLNADRLRSARADLDVVGMRAMMETLDPAVGDGGAHAMADIAAKLEFAPRHQWLLRRWLGVLAAHGHLERDADGRYRVLSPVPRPACPDVFSLCADLGYPPAFADFMQSCNEHLAALAQDRVRVQELLFADGDMVTAVAGYRDNVVGQYLNRAAREIIAGLVTGLAGDRSPVRILELGAGTGGTTDDVIAGLSGMPVDYHFTDVSTFFLHGAAARFAEYPQIRYGILDLNTDLAQQGCYDIVLAANVLHNARHVGRTLRRIREVVNPGGAIVFIETCKANYQLLTSLKFLMSPNPGQPHPGQSDVRAGARIFLAEREWLDQLTLSGFTPLAVLPQIDHPLRVLDQRLFTAMRER